jgi:hypothetical protein
MKTFAQDEHVIWDQADYFRTINLNDDKTECPSNISVNLNNNNNNSLNSEESETSSGFMQFLKKYCFSIFKFNASEPANTNNNNNKQDMPKLNEISSNVSNERKLIVVSEKQKENLVKNLCQWGSSSSQTSTSNDLSYDFNENEKRMILTNKMPELLNNTRDDVSNANTTMIINEALNGLEVNLSDISTCTGTISTSSTSELD